CVGDTMASTPSHHRYCHLDETGAESVIGRLMFSKKKPPRETLDFECPSCHEVLTIAFNPSVAQSCECSECGEKLSISRARDLVCEKAKEAVDSPADDAVQRRQGEEEEDSSTTNARQRSFFSSWAPKAASRKYRQSSLGDAEPLLACVQVV
ncbi:MAG: hypothetical protein SGPRY_012840, partial [Prymnesium sp.]